jgi:hypothetical protein
MSRDSTAGRPNRDGDACRGNWAVAKAELAASNQLTFAAVN